MIKLLPSIKREHPWLNSVAHASLGLTCKDLKIAYTAFFKKTKRRPRFKKRGESSQSYPVRCDKEAFYFDGEYVKVTKVGRILYKTNYVLPMGMEHKFNNVRIIYDEISSKWFMGFGMEIEPAERKSGNKCLGIDLGVKNLAVVAFGDKKYVYGNINKSDRVKSLKNKEKYINKKIMRKYGINNQKNPETKWVETSAILRYRKIETQITRKLANIRKNYNLSYCKQHSFS